MRITLAAVVALALGWSETCFAQRSADPRVADLVQSGILRIGLGLGSSTTATKNPASGEVKGIALELGACARCPNRDQARIRRISETRRGD
jgi:hypothetical protein